MSFRGRAQFKTSAQCVCVRCVLSLSQNVDLMVADHCSIGLCDG